MNCLASHLVDRLGQTLDVSRRDTSHGDTSVFGSVDGVLNGQLVFFIYTGCCTNIGLGYCTNLLGKGIHLLRLETSEGEHTDLFRSS